MNEYQKNNMAAKKPDQPTISDSNVNTNNINVNVKVEKEKAKRKSASQKQTKPNWVLKTIVVGLIGLALSIIGYFVKGQFEDGGHKPDVIDGSGAPISGTKVK